MTSIYKVQLFRWNLPCKDKYRDYCLDEGIVAFGWPAKESVLSIEEYCNKGYKWFDKSRDDRYTNLTSWKNTLESMKRPETEDIYVWSYTSSRDFYLGKLSGELELPSEENWKLDDPIVKRKEVGLVRKCDWRYIDFDFVPGDVATHARNDGTIRLIATDEKDQEKYNLAYVNYCKFLYENHHRLKEIEDWEKLDNVNFYQLVHTDDLEDIVGIYLQTKDYYIFPSTNKQGTRDYEYKLVNKKTGKEAIIQCKNNKTIDLKLWEKFETGEYKDYEVYILTIKEDLHPQDNNYDEHTDSDMIKYSYDNGRLKVLNKENLKNWASKKENKKIMPERIKRFLEISCEEE